MAAVVIPQLTNHFAIFCKSSVKVENTRTGCSSRSGGTATKTSLAPISIPAAFASSMGRSSRHIPFLLRPRLPVPAAVFSSPSGLECFFCWDMLVILSAQAEAKSRKSRYSSEGNQPGVLPQAVTTVWRTELGTTLVFGFNSTTEGSAYFHFLGFYQSAMHRRMNQVPRRYGPAPRGRSACGAVGTIVNALASSSAVPVQLIQDGGCAARYSA